jgi:hypothetical protein
VANRSSAEWQSGVRESRSDGSIWLPLFVEWQPQRMHYLEGMRVGLSTAGADVRVDVVGAHGRELNMLRVRCPGPSIEAAEHRLLRLVPHDDEDWASGVFCVLHQRWREYALFSGTEEVMDRVTKRLDGLKKRDHPRFSGARYATVFSRPACLFTYARSATEVVRCLPDVHASREAEGEPREWLAIDVAHTIDDIAGLTALGVGLERAGFAVCRYEWRGGGSALLTIYAGEGTIEDLEVRLAAALAPPVPGWATRYRPWSWEPAIWVHRHTDSAGWRPREWLERELGDPVVDAGTMPDHEIALKVPVAHVDRALELLARLPAEL